MLDSSRLKCLILERGITQRRLACDLYLSPNTINGYLKNRRSPDCETTKRLAVYFDTSVDYLLGSNCLRRYPDIALDERENILISSYRALNGDGKRMMERLIEILCNQAKYTKKAENS